MKFKDDDGNTWDTDSNGVSKASELGGSVTTREVGDTRATWVDLNGALINVLRKITIEQARELFELPCQHEAVDTGFVKSWCRHCNADMVWKDGRACVKN